MKQLELEIKSLIIKTLDLEDMGPDDIDSAAPLFGEGLGLDSVDALELGLAIKKQYDISIDAETRHMQEHFATVASLAKFVAGRRKPV
jgi:acyl carrier protein